MKMLVDWSDLGWPFSVPLLHSGNLQSHAAPRTSIRSAQQPEPIITIPYSGCAKFNMPTTGGVLG